MKPPRTVSLVAVVALLVVGLSAQAASAQAASAQAAPRSTPIAAHGPVLPASAALPANVGIDDSYPQCTPTHTSTQSSEFPANTPFAILGLNGGIASTFNTCFQSEYEQAILLTPSTDQPVASVYLNTGDPALAAAWWPSSNTTKAGTPITNPNGTCAHLAGAACAFVYGYSMAELDYAKLTGLTANSDYQLAAPSMWWLDVETSNTWQSDTSANAASIAGMVVYLHSVGQTVGVYSTTYQWGKIAGATGTTSVLAGIPSWLAGWSAAGAPTGCESRALTPHSQVQVTQYVLSGQDYDYACQLFPAADSGVSPSGTVAPGTILRATHGTWAAGTVSYTYQWFRNGVAISGATQGSLTTTTSDLGSSVTVTITGVAKGYRTTSVTSAGVAVLRQLTGRPKPQVAQPHVRLPVRSQH